MMEEIHSIFAAGAGAVTKLVDNRFTDGRSIGVKSRSIAVPDEGNMKTDIDKRTIERLFHQKYPYEYLAEDRSSQFAKAAEEFYREHGML